jgi:hypothetical protein
MAEPKKVNPAVTFFVNYGEKLALAIAVLALVGCAAFWFGMSGEDPSLGAVENNVKKLSDEGKTAHTEMTAPPSENLMAKSVNPWTSLVASARPGDDYSGFIVTTAVGTGRTVAIVKKIPVQVPPVAYVGAEVAIDSITVGWAYQDFTAQVINKMARDKEKTEAAKATHFVLERETNGSGKWEVLADKMDVKVQSYLDTKIEPKSKYAYRIKAYSTDKNFLERGGKIDPETGATANPDGLVNVVTGAPVATLGIWKITFTNATKPADAAKGMVYVKIEKFEKGVGKVEKAHIHYDGDQIGWWDEPGNPEPVSKHRVSTKTGKSIEVDFNMGAQLVTVNPMKLVVDVKRCKPIFDKSTGNKTGCDQIVEKRNFDTALITYKDDEGLKKIHVPSPSSLDQLCDEHGGRKIIVAPPGGDRTPGTSEEPKMDPKEAIKAKKEMDAEKLFDEAEKALDKNRALALTCYNRLMKEYIDTDFVQKNKKAIIEERIASLKKTK